VRVLDLFSGVGGFSLGLERAGFTTVAFCECDPACHLVLNKHWPTVPIFPDIQTLDISEVPEFDVICGGFPCQDISNAGRGAGLEGDRSGLWWSFHRLIKEARPRWVIVENVSMLRRRGLGTVLRSLDEIGYDAQWNCIPASALGAPHERDRIWIVSHPNGEGTVGQSKPEQEGRGRSGDLGEEVADTGTQGLQVSQRLRDNLEEALRGWATAPRPAAQRCPVSGGTTYSWDAEPGMGRVADGVPNRVDRLKQLGNSLVPQIPELIGKAIMETCNGT
jgi:DNA (cytosine-5)-methyltransferase 1